MLLNNKNTARLILVGIALMFFIPIVVSWYLVFFTDFKMDTKGAQHGRLINPVIEIGEISAKEITAPKEIAIEGKWTLVFFVDIECDLLCEEHLYQLRQIRLALGEDMLKVDRLAILNEPVSWSKYGEAYFGQKYIDNISSDITELQNQFKSYTQFDYQSIYLIDPYGFLMMQYPQGTEPSGIIKDIERLIKNAK